MLKRGVRGLALLEALLSLCLLGLLALGLLGLQLRTMEHSRASMHRAQAARLLEDLADRARAHPAGMPLPAEAADWNAPEVLPDCRRAACDPASLARWDIARWKRGAAQGLPRGRAAVLDAAGANVSGGRQWIAALAWQPATDPDPAPAGQLPPDDANAGPRCPPGLLCHTGHVHP
jgi:type IV pilus assembly protein PilV